MTGTEDPNAKQNDGQLEQEPLNQEQLNQEQQPLEQRLMDQARRYLEEKYGRMNVQQKNVLFGDLINPYHSVEYAFEDERGTESFWVRFEGEDSQIVSDSYAGYLVRPVIEENLAKQAEKLFGQAKVYAETATDSYPDAITGPVPFEQLVRLREDLPIVYGSVFVNAQGLDEAEFEQKADALFESWEKDGLDSVLWVIALPAQAYEKLNDATSRAVREDSSGYVWYRKKAI